jgi:uncharacterized repeat protein (TIGR03943 family)
MSAFVHRYLPSAILMIWGCLLAQFYLSGRIASYLHPFFQPLTAMSAIILLLLAASLLFFPQAREACWGSCCGEEHGRQRPRRVTLSAVVLVFPLLIAAAASPDQYGAAVVRNRGFIDQLSDLPGYESSARSALAESSDGEAAASGQGMEENYLPKNESGQIKAQNVDLIFAAEEPAMRADFEGKELELIGQFMPAHGKNAKANQFSLVRMFVICCAADARPVAVSVETKDAQSIAEMSWIKVIGKATFPVESGRRVPLVMAESVTSCNPPEETFIY